MRANGGEDAEFIPGLKLSESYYHKIVAPIIKSSFPTLKYSAGLLGSGSEVLGYDTPQSMDHNWGLRLFIFLTDGDFAHKQEIGEALRRSLPHTFNGHSTSFGPPDNRGVRIAKSPKDNESVEVDHYILFFTIRSFFEEYFGKWSDPDIFSWLIIPQQKLLEVTSGKIFHDDLGLQSEIRKFRYYPRDIWLYKLASQWSRISQEESYVGRASQAGDELGSRIIGSRMVKELMELCFLMERKYSPYSKWFGTAFSRFKIAKKLKPVLIRVLEAENYPDRELWLSKAYEILARKQNLLKIGRPIPTKVTRYYNRPFLIIHADNIANEIRKEIKNARIRSLPLMGSVDQITDNSEVLENRLGLVRSFYDLDG